MGGRKWEQEAESKIKCVAAVEKFWERLKVCKIGELYPRGAFEGVESVCMKRDMVRETQKGRF